MFEYLYICDPYTDYMKKIIFVSVITIMSLVGCKAEEVEEVLNGDSPVSQPSLNPPVSPPVTQVQDNTSVDGTIHLSTPTLNSDNLSNTDYLIVQGYSGESFSLIEFFDDLNCQNKIADANQEDFANGGIYIQFALNQQTQVYGQITRQSGQTDCQYLFSFTQDSVAPQAPIFTSIDTSTYNQNGYVLVYGQTQSDVDAVKLYSDSQCLQQVGVGLGQDFSTGINFWYANQGNTTEVYAIAQDASGNQSACTQMTQFVY